VGLAKNVLKVRDQRSRSWLDWML